MKMSSLFFNLKLVMVGFVNSSEQSNSNRIFKSSTDYPINSNILVGKGLGSIFQKPTTRFSYACILVLILLFSFNKTNAQSGIIGNPIKIGNIEVAQYDFPNRMKWDDANRTCLNLGQGWRLPTKDELNILYNNKNQIGNLQDPYLAYWSSTEFDNNIAWYGVMKDGFTRSTEKFYESGVRAVRNSIINITQLNEQKTETYQNGDKYVGEMKNRMRNVQGTYTFSNGEKYVGEWKEGLLNTPLNCKECKEIVDIFHDSFVKGVSINSIDFFSMKALVQNCYQNNFKECGGKMEKQLDRLLGNLEGGPLTQGETSNWRLPVRTDLSRITTNKYDAISNFRKSYEESLIKDCSECKEIVDKFYNSYTNKINLSESEFFNLKNKVQTCFFQKVSGCGSQMERQLNVLTGNLSGGPPTSSLDPKSKWRIKSGKNGPFTPEFQELTPIPNGDVIFRYNNLYGVKDKNNLVFIYPKYEKIEHINFRNSDYLIVQKEKKKGVIDFFENMKLPLEYKRIHSNPFNSNLLIYNSLDGSNGVIYDHFLKKGIESDELFFTRQFTYFRKDGKYGFLDNNGEVKIEPNYDKVSFIGEDNIFRYFTLEDVMLSSGSNPTGGSIEVNYIPSNNILVVEKDNKFGLIGDNLKEVLPPKYDKIGHVNIVTSTCVKGLIPIWENGKMGYVNELGEILISPKYDMINGFGIKNWLKDEVSYVSIDKKWGLFSNKNRVELTPIQYDNISYDKESLFKVEIQNKTGLLNFSGKEILSPDNYEITGFDKKQSFLILKKEGKYGLFNKDGSLFTSCIYDEIDPYFNSNLYSRVKKDFKWGVIDRNGNQIIEARFDNLITIANNFYQVSSGNKWGLIDKSGNLIISTKYDEPFTFSDGKANVKLDGLAFRINERDEVVYNNYQNSTLSQLEVGGVNMKKQIESRFRDVFSEFAAKELVGAFLGSKTSSNETLLNQTNEIMLTVEGWLGGQMTNAQLNEFYDILKQEAALVNFALGIMAESLKSSNSSSSSFQDRTPSQSNSSSSRSVACNYCKPYDKRGHSIKDYDPYKKIYSNWRNVLRPGHKVCDICQGTGTCLAGNSPENAPGVCEGNYICRRCHGDRFIVCKECEGSGKSQSVLDAIYPNNN